ncbi:MAG: divalent metal cation transporter [bacterium]
MLTLGTMFTVQAAVALLTAGLAKALFGLAWSPAVVVALLIGLCAGLLAVGRYAWLDAINKVVVLVLTLSTLAATVLALPRIDWGAIPWWPAAGFGAGDMLFAAALVGWMPSAIDLAVWHSLWTLARREQTGRTPTRRAVLADFHLGYWGAAALALCFVILGAGVMYGRGVPFQATAGGFAAQVIELYVSTLGDWSRPLISISAFACMFSTTFTVVDGFPRALSVLARRFTDAERPWSGEEGSRRLYWASLVVIGAGSVLICLYFLKSLKELVDLATTLSFLTAPALAILNHRAITGAEVPAAARPSRGVLGFSLLSIVVLTGLAVAYLWVRFGGA